MSTTTERTAFDFTKATHHDTYPAITPVPHTLAGRVVLITGASRGIGRALAIAHAQAGAAGLVLGARTAAGLKETAAAIAALPTGSTPVENVQLLDLNVTDARSVGAAADAVRARWGRLDVVVSNAGYMADAERIVDSEPEEWWEAWAVNVRGAYLIARAFVPLLLATDGGERTLVNISTAGVHVTMPGLSAYAASKFAGLRLVEELVGEHAGDGLLAYNVHPGGIVTSMSAKLPADFASTAMIDTTDLAAHTVVWLIRERREWLNARYVSANWDVEELLELREAVERGDLLKMRMVV